MSCGTNQSIDAEDKTVYTFPMVISPKVKVKLIPLLLFELTTTSQSSALAINPRGLLHNVFCLLFPLSDIK